MVVLRRDRVLELVLIARLFDDVCVSFQGHKALHKQSDSMKLGCDWIVKGQCLHGYCQVEVRCQF
jgi:hypothetical protein